MNVETESRRKFLTFPLPVVMVRSCPEPPFTHPGRRKRLNHMDYKDEIQKRRTFAIISHPRRGQDHADRKVPAFRRGDPGGGRGEVEQDQEKHVL